MHLLDILRATGTLLNNVRWCVSVGYRTEELCVKVEMAVLGSPSLMCHNYGFCGRKATLNLMCFPASGLVRVFVALTVTAIRPVDTDCLAPW